METINIHTAKTTLSKLVERALSGEAIVISRNGKPVVDLIPHKEPEVKKQRCGGQWTGKLWVAPDDEQTDAQIAKSFNDSNLFPKE